MNPLTQAFADKILAETKRRMIDEGFSLHVYADYISRVVEGNVYDKVDIGPAKNISGKFMVEKSTGRIFGILGYGQVNKKKFYGNVADTTGYFWGNYSPAPLK
jgi:hypothetical protein